MSLSITERKRKMFSYGAIMFSAIMFTGSPYSLLAQKHKTNGLTGTPYRNRPTTFLFDK